MLSCMKKKKNTMKNMAGKRYHLRKNIGKSCIDHAGKILRI